MLDHIVCDTVLGAQQCLSFLKENNLGRINLLALDKVGRWIVSLRMYWVMRWRER